MNEAPWYQRSRWGPFVVVLVYLYAVFAIGMAFAVGIAWRKAFGLLLERYEWLWQIAYWLSWIPFFHLLIPLLVSLAVIGPWVIPCYYIFKRFDGWNRKVGGLSCSTLAIRWFCWGWESSTERTTQSDPSPKDRREFSYTLDVHGTQKYAYRNGTEAHTCVEQYNPPHLSFPPIRSLVNVVAQVKEWDNSNPYYENGRKKPTPGYPTYNVKRGVEPFVAFKQVPP